MTDQTNHRPLEEELAEMAGYRSENDQGMGAIDADEVETAGNFTPTDVYQGETSNDPDLVEPEESLDLLQSANLREGETDDVMEAVEGGLSYVPPIDPVYGDDGDDSDGTRQDILGGFATSADTAEPPADLPLAERVMLRLRRDAATVDLAGSVHLREQAGGVIIVEGRIGDYTDEELIVGVVESVEGVEEVRSHLRLPEDS